MALPSAGITGSPVGEGLGSVSAVKGRPSSRPGYPTGALEANRTCRSKTKGGRSTSEDGGERDPDSKREVPLSGYLARQASNFPVLLEEEGFREVFRDQVLRLVGKIGVGSSEAGSIPAVSGTGQVPNPSGLDVPDVPSLGEQPPIVGRDLPNERKEVHLGEGSGCRRIAVLKRFVKLGLGQLFREFGRHPDRKPEWSKLRCGKVRATLGDCFDGVDPLFELSLKSIQKLEDRFCGPCSEAIQTSMVNDWTESRFREVAVDLAHVELFREQFSRNVEEGWNRRPYPYVPNGHATLFHSRREGGSWNEESFENWCRPTLVISSGKPRVITCFAEFNTRVLTPLHQSLYAGLQGRSWLLVGEPENHHVNALNGDGEFVSLDYRAATDSFKTVYVRAAIEVLISKGIGINEEEARCLRALGELRLSPDGPLATRGQPMGSVMSFPLLCLFNKTVHDLALNDLLQEKKISFKEWTRHRCLINGDDGLTRSPVKGLDFRSRIDYHSSRVGMEVNLEKSSVSDEFCEINSTLFAKGSCPSGPKLNEGGEGPAVLDSSGLTRRVKSNLSALRMRPEVNDVLGFADQACRSDAGFLAVVLRNRRILAKQVDKFFDRLNLHRRNLLLKDSRIRKALRGSPRRSKDCPSGYLEMGPVPSGYDLSRLEEVEAINAEVKRVRTVRGGTEGGFVKPREPVFRTSAEYSPVLSEEVLHPKRVARETLTLRCLSSAWERKQFKRLGEAEHQGVADPDDVFGETSFWETIEPGVKSPRANHVIGLVREARKRRKLCQAPRSVMVESLLEGLRMEGTVSSGASFVRLGRVGSNQADTSIK